MLPSSLLIEGTELPLQIRENPRARRLTLRLSPEAGGGAILTIPPCFSQKQVVKFIEKSKPWIARQKARMLQKNPYVEGMILPVFGKSYELRHKPSESFRSWWGEDHLLVYAPAEKFAVSVQKCLHQMATQFLTTRTTAYASQLGKTVNRITLRDTRSRWGSCSVHGNISYSWRVVFAPEQVADYLCAHEVAHLVEMNHSPCFWRIVEGFCPDYKNLRRWLSQNGKSLFQYGT